METGDVLAFRTVGVCHSVFANKRGVPRQGALAPSSRGVVRLRKHMSDEILRGLEAFSHAWLVFVFSRNSNAKKQQAWLRQESDQGSVTFPGKIKPPLLHGQSTGVYSTRTPHRPNPIGLTLCKIDSVDAGKRELLVSGIDLCDETPILDIKPFVPGDVPGGSVQFAPWVRSEEQWRWNVDFESSAKPQLRQMVEAQVTRFYESADELEQAIREVLELDVRAVHQGRGDTGAQAAVHQCVIDSVQVFFAIDPAAHRIIVSRVCAYDVSTLGSFLKEKN